jgi:hypothetical protein
MATQPAVESRRAVPIEQLSAYAEGSQARARRLASRFVSRRRASPQAERQNGDAGHGGGQTTWPGPIVSTSVSATNGPPQARHQRHSRGKLRRRRSVALRRQAGPQ